MSAAIGIYALLARGDRHSMIRTSAHLGSVALGLIFVVVGLDRAVELLQCFPLGVPVAWSDVAHPWFAPYDFISPLTGGALVAVVYALSLWLRAEAAGLPVSPTTIGFIAEAAASAIVAVPFFWAIGRMLYATFCHFTSGEA